MREICKAIVDALAEAGGLANGTIGNLNMVATGNVEPTDEEAKALTEASEQFCQRCRFIVRQWLGRLPRE